MPPRIVLAWAASVGAAVFVLLAFVPLLPVVDALDRAISLQIGGLRESWLTHVMVFVTRLSSPLLVALYAVISAAVLLRQRRRKAAALLAGSLLVSIVMQNGAKLLLARPRPPGAVGYLSQFSYPSGHATVSTAFFLSSLCLLGPHIKTRNRRLVFGCTMVLAPLVVGYSRIYLGVHWLSDVVGGWALGGCIVALVLLLLHVGPSERRVNEHQSAAG